MPGRDGTGPMGGGAKTGRGMGVCNNTGNAGNAGNMGGLGRGRGRGGMGNGMGNGLGIRGRRGQCRVTSNNDVNPNNK